MVLPMRPHTNRGICGLLVLRKVRRFSNYSDPSVIELIVLHSLSGITVTLPNGLEQTSAAISLLKLNFNYWSYSRITFGEVLLPLELGIISLIMAMICLFLRCIFRQLRRLVNGLFQKWCFAVNSFFQITEKNTITLIIAGV